MLGPELMVMSRAPYCHGHDRESDAWKAHMRRQTYTVNWFDDPPLA